MSVSHSMSGRKRARRVGKGSRWATHNLIFMLARCGDSESGPPQPNTEPALHNRPVVSGFTACLAAHPMLLFYVLHYWGQISGEAGKCKNDDAVLKFHLPHHRVIPTQTRHSDDNIIRTTRNGIRRGRDGSKTWVGGYNIMAVVGH